MLQCCALRRLKVTVLSTLVSEGHSSIHFDVCLDVTLLSLHLPDALGGGGGIQFPNVAAQFWRMWRSLLCPGYSACPN